MKKPKPVNKTIVCSECGLPWEKHTARRKTVEPTLDDCVALLKAELARPRHPFAQQFGMSSGGYRITNAIAQGSGGTYSA